MQKHYSLKDFVNIIRPHSVELRNLASENGKLSHKLLLEVFVGSDKAIAKRFSYVIGSMRGSQDLQFTTMIDKLKRAGHSSVAKELESRNQLPCIDIQECIWLLNDKSSRDRSRNYNYSDYSHFKNKQCISGSAANFTIKWDVLDESTRPNNEADIAVPRNVVKTDNKNEISQFIKPNKRCIGEHDYETAFNMKEFRRIINQYKDKIELKPSGWWQTATSQQFWDEFCMQVMVTQATRSGRETVYRNSDSWSQLSLDRMQPFRLQQNKVGLREYFEKELTNNGMRMAKKKADTLCRSVFNSCILNDDLDFVLVEQIAELWKRHVTTREIYNNEVQARDIIKSTVYGFGDKSASDFLLEIGFADYLIAFDVRVLGILRKLGLYWLEQDAIQNDSSKYKKLQDFIFKVCENTKTNLRTIDRIFYQKKDEIISGL